MGTVMTQPPGRDRHQARPLHCTQPQPTARRRPRKRDAPGACPGGQESYELTEEDREWARRTVASLPPLTDRQRDILALLLRTRR
jgi:hypothetical protein